MPSNILADCLMVGGVYSHWEASGEDAAKERYVPLWSVEPDDVDSFEVKTRANEGFPESNDLIKVLSIASCIPNIPYFV